MTGRRLFKSSNAVFILISRLALAFPPQLAIGADLYLFREEIVANDRSIAGGQASITLYRLTASHLLQVPLNLGPPRFPDFTIADPEMRLLALGASTMPSQVRVMSMDRPGVFVAAELNIPEWAGNYDEAGVPGSAPTLMVDLLSLDMRKALSGTPDQDVIKRLDTVTGQWQDASADVYRQLRLIGGIGGFEVDSTGHWYLRQFTGGQLMLAVAQRVFPMGPPLPPRLRLPAEGIPVLVLSNSYFSAVRDQKYDSRGPKTVYLLLDKDRSQWDRLEVPGGRSWSVRAFGPWMAGLEDQWQGVKQRRPIPGRRTGAAWHRFITVDDYLEEKGIYRSGILYVYNVQTHRYYQWDTHNGDCEVLLVEGGQVYYRVDQAIYRAKIGEKELDKPELLVEDTAVPGIHWAFFGPDTPAKGNPPGPRE